MKMGDVAILGFSFMLIFFAGLNHFIAQADQPHVNCECRELVRIRMILEHQFGVVCDERHCEGQSSSGQGGSLP